jgi:hypothetical protein
VRTTSHVAAPAGGRLLLFTVRTRDVTCSLLLMREALGLEGSPSVAKPRGPAVRHTRLASSAE